MDYSSLGEAQQQQQQQQSDQQQAYDPAQAQAYAAYYAACDQYYAASAYYHQPYYPHDYSSSSTAATAGVYYAEAQPDSAATQADATQIQQSGSHGTAYAAAMEQDGYSYQATAGLNPAAVAALSQLSQLTGSIDAAERMMAAGMHNRTQSSHYQQYSHPMTMQHGGPSIRPGVGGTAHRGGGRRGGGPMRGRGGNRGRIGQRHSGRDGGGPPPLRGSGHGRMSRGRGRRPQHFPPDSQQRQTAIATTLEPSVSAAAHAQGRPLFTPKVPQKSLIPVAWCDICRVDCNSLEILEQHKNGKRHKRTVQRVQEIQAQQKVISAELQFNTAAKPDLFLQGEDEHKLSNNGQGSTYATNRVIPSSDGGTEAGKGLAASAYVGDVQKDIASSAQEPVVEGSIKGFVASENNQQEMDIEQCPMPEGQAEPVSDIANTGGLLTDASQDETLPMDGLSKKRKMAGYDRNERWRGSKQKMMRIGRGGKHFKSFERTHNRPFERPKDRPRDRPRVCTVCNVMCDTMAVFECHLSGKKHISRIKRFEGHGSVYGPISVYIPPNQPTAYPSKGPEPLFYGLQNLETLQQEAALRHEIPQQGAHAIDSLQMETLAVEQRCQVGSFEEAEGAAPESEVKQSLGHPDAMEDEQVVAMPDLDGQNSLNEPDAGGTNNSASDDSDFMDSTVLPIVPDATLPEYEASNEADIVGPGVDAKSEEALPNSE
ncbi:hypothetical protein IEQ34_001391 [Dendrobium chrysotoxum]|uniref:U1-type domain-containing protein n=1 Tax=Dendrobium chrysotoxum TaxID=161865 RepID=A0AAV7HQN2_DENCH|nr:hypothetical protein IEQ34_001391 [Dendrobium chrysotoxum]